MFSVGFFSLWVIIWEMNISGSGQPPRRLTKANHLWVFLLRATKNLVALALPFCCVCVALVVGFCWPDSCRDLL